MSRRSNSQKRRYLALGIFALLLVGAILFFLHAMKGDQFAFDRSEHAPDAVTRAQVSSTVVAETSQPEESRDTPEASVRAPLSSAQSVHVVDKETGQGIPWLQVELSSANSPSFRGETDIDGICLLPNDTKPSQTALRISDDAVGFVQAIKTVPYDAAGVATVRVALGPTYVFQLRKPPVPADQLFARIAATGNPTGNAVRWEALRGGAQPWVRFPAYFRGAKSANGSPAVIKIDSASGLFTARVQAPGTIGVYLDPLVVEFEASSKIFGIVSRVEGAPIAGARIGYRPVSNLEGPLPRSYGDGTVTKADGAYEIACLPPGEYVLTLDVPGSFPSTALVRGTPGTATRKDFVVDCDATARLEGMVISKRPRLQTLRPIIRLDALDPPFTSRCFPVDLAQPREDGAPPMTEAHKPIWGTFRVDCLPEGKYALRVIAKLWANQSAYYTDPDPIVVDVPTDRIAVEVLQSGVASELGFSVVDGRTQAPIADFDVVLFTEIQQEGVKFPDGVPLMLRHCRPDTGLLLVMKDAPLRWLVTAPSYGPVFGNEAPVDWAVHGKGYTCRVELDTGGWGGLVMAYRAEGDGTWSVQADADVLMDGHPVGVTNGEGFLQVLARDPPRALTVRKHGYGVGAGRSTPPFASKTGPYGDQSLFIYVLHPD